MLESTLVSLGVVAAGVIGTFAVLKMKVNDSLERDKEQDKHFEEYKTQQNERIVNLEIFMNEKKPLLDHLSRSENATFNKLDFYGTEIAAMQQKLGQTPTMKEFRDEFVSKEIFKQLEKHMDEKFSKLELGLNEILKELRSK